MAQLLPFRSFRSEAGRGRRRPGQGAEGRLAEQLRANDEAALAAIMERYGESIRAFTFRLVGDSYVAEEICQDTLLKAWQQAVPFQAEAHLRAWLFRVARNSAIDYLRKRRPSTEELQPVHPAPANLPEEEVERAWVAAQLGRALAQLPVAYREVVDLRYFHQLGYAEIARVLDIPLGTVKSRLAYALDRLSRLLREMGVEIGPPPGDGVDAE